MTAFFIYSPDGGPQPAAALEYALNLEVPRFELIQRTRTGVGEAAYVVDRPEDKTFARAWRAIRRRDEWPAATSEACLWMWWRYAKDPVPDVDHETADEVWRLTPDGAVTRKRFADDVRRRKTQSPDDPQPAAPPAPPGPARPSIRPFDT